MLTGAALAMYSSYSRVAEANVSQPPIRSKFHCGKACVFIVRFYLTWFILRLQRWNFLINFSLISRCAKISDTTFTSCTDHISVF